MNGSFTVEGLMWTGRSEALASLMPQWMASQVSS